MNSIFAISVALTVMFGYVHCQDPCNSTMAPLALIPIQMTVPGIRYKPHEPRPQMLLEMFMGIHDEVSAEQFEIIKDVLDHYGNDKLDVVIHQMPLPQYRNALLATQAIFAIEESPVSSKLFDFIEELLENAEDFSTDNTFDLSEAEVLNMTAAMAVEETGVNKDDFLLSIDAYRFKAISTFMYGVKRGVASTPAFFLNGAEINGEAPPSYEQWIELLDNYITPSPPGAPAK